MNKTEFITELVAKTNLSKKDAEAFLNAFTETVTETLVKKEKIQLIGFGTFETRERAARQGRNPLTKETIEIAAATIPAFKPGKALKDLVNVPKNKTKAKKTKK